MTNIEGFEIPEDLYYDVENHVWVKIVDNFVLVGLDDVGQYLARRIVFIKPKPPGSAISKGEPIAIIESVKWVGPIPSPLTGTVIEINQEVLRRPALINQKPYDAWIAKLRPEKLSEEIKYLVTGNDAIEKQHQDIIKRKVRKARLK